MTEKKPRSHDYQSQGDIWKALAIKAQEGDRKAYEQLLRAIVPFIKSRIASQLANVDWIDDVAQDVLLSVHKSLHSYSPDRPFTPWLMAVVQFRKTDFLRQYYKRKKVSEHATTNTDTFDLNVTTSPHAGELKDIEDAINTLPDKQKAIFKMIKIDGYTAKEVAKKTGMSVSAVKVSAHRSAAKLKDLLG